MTSVVRPPASAVSATCGESQCTCGSTPPGVTTMPVASTTAVAVSSTTSTPSIVSGLPARPIATIRPSRTPKLVYFTPSTGSATSPPTIASSTPPRSARTPSPSRIVFPNPGRIRSGPPASSASGTSHRSESASRTPSGTAVPPLAGQRQRGLHRPRGVERAVGEAGVAADDPVAAERQEDDLAREPRVEPDLRARLDREPHAPRRGALEAQHAVDLEEMEVRGDADRVLALVDDRERRRLGEPLDADVALVRRLGRADRVMQHDQAAAVAEQRLDLDAVHQLRHAVGDVVRAERPVAGGLGRRIGGAVARRLADGVGDHGDRLRLPEPQPAGVAPAGELGGEE